MPTLKSLSCSISLTLQSSLHAVPMPEHLTSYADGIVSTYLALPPPPPSSFPFSVSLKSSGYIAPGLAMFVYIDGVYQCNRNRTKLKVPGPDVERSDTEVNFTVRQKEQVVEIMDLCGTQWAFERLETYQSTEGASSGQDESGTIEVVVLRCFAEEPASKTVSGLDGTSDTINGWFGGQQSSVRDAPSHASTTNSGPRRRKKRKGKNRDHEPTRRVSPRAQMRAKRSADISEQEEGHIDTGSWAARDQPEAEANDNTMWGALDAGPPSVVPEDTGLNDNDASVDPDLMNVWEQSMKVDAWGDPLPNDDTANAVAVPDAQGWNQSTPAPATASPSPYGSWTLGVFDQGDNKSGDQQWGTDGNLDAAKLETGGWDTWQSAAEPGINSSGEWDAETKKNTAFNVNPGFDLSSMGDAQANWTTASKPLGNSEKTVPAPTITVGGDDHEQTIGAIEAGERVSMNQSQKSAQTTKSRISRPRSRPLMPAKTAKMSRARRTAKTVWPGIYSERSNPKIVPVVSTKPVVSGHTAHHVVNTQPSSTHIPGPQPALSNSKETDRRSSSPEIFLDPAILSDSQDYHNLAHEHGFRSPFCSMAQARTHKVNFKPEAAYRHKIASPRYMDSHDNPYAVFVFYYRDRSVIERMLGHSLAETEPEHRARLSCLSKDELLDELIKEKRHVPLPAFKFGNTAAATPTTTMPFPLQSTWSNADWGKNPKGAGPWGSSRRIQTAGQAGIKLAEQGPTSWGNDTIKAQEDNGAVNLEPVHDNAGGWGGGADDPWTGDPGAAIQDDNRGQYGTGWAETDPLPDSSGDARDDNVVW